MITARFIRPLFLMIALHPIVVSAAGAIDAKTFDLLISAQEHAQNSQYGAAIHILDRIKVNTSTSSYARAQMWHYYGFVFASQNKLEKAAGAYRNLLTEQDVAEGLRQTALQNLGQLCLQLEDYRCAIDYLEQWAHSVQSPAAETFVLLAQAHYALKEKTLAVVKIERAMSLAEDLNQAIKESWLQLQAILYYDAGSYHAAIKALRKLVTRFPRYSHIRQLASLYGVIENRAAQLALLDGIYLAGQLNSWTEIINLAYMHTAAGAPYYAGSILSATQQADHNTTAQPAKTLAAIWSQARETERAIATLENAVGQHQNGDILATLGRHYFNDGQYEVAANRAKRAAQHPQQSNPGRNFITWGVSLFYLSRFEDALTVFRQAKQHKNSFDLAREWERYTLQEINRISQLSARI